MPTISKPAKRQHDMANPRKNLEAALRVLDMVPVVECGLVPHPLVTVRAEIMQALEAMPS